MNKKESRLRRARKTRMKMRTLNMPRVQIVRSCKHIGAQLVSADGATVLAQASTMEAALRGKHSGNIAGAQEVGKLLAERIKALNSIALNSIEAIGFDRSGYKYHGRVRALAESLRGDGINF